MCESNQENSIKTGLCRTAQTLPAELWFDRRLREGQSLGCATNSNLKFFELVKFGGFRSIVGLLVGISSLEQWNASTEHIRV